MSSRTRISLALFGTTLAMTTLVGCVDEEARERAQVQENILDYNTELQAIAIGSPVPGTEEFQTMHQDLTALVSKINGIKSGESGQQAAKSMLLSSTLSNLAALDVAQVEQLERQAATACVEIAAIARSSADLNFRVQSIDTFDLSSSRDELNSSQELVNSELTVLNQQIGELLGPINDRVSQNEMDSADARQLRQQSSDLMQAARESGYAAGFDSFEEAIQAQRRADRIEFEISQRMIELDLNLQAEHGFLDINRQNAENAMQAINEARIALDGFEQIGSSDNAASRQTMSDLRARLDERLAELKARDADSLAPAYDAAIASLERAAREAQTAASKTDRDGAGAARITAARAHESLGKLHWSRAQGIKTRLMANEMLTGAADALGLGDSVYDEIDRLKTAFDESVEAANAAYAQAQQLAGQVTGGDQKQLSAYKSNLEMAIAAMAGEDISASMRPESSSDSTSGIAPASAGGSASGPGLGSPEEMVQYMTSRLQSGELIDLLDVTYAATPEGQRGIETSRAILGAMLNFMAALENKFGAQAAPMVQGMRQGMGASFPDLTQATEQERTADRVVYNITRPTGEPDTFTLLQVDGAWYIDGDDLDDQQLAQLKQMESAQDSLVQMLNSFVQRIESGDIASMADLGPAMQSLGAAMQNLGGN